LESNILKLLGDKKSILTIAQHRYRIEIITAEPQAGLLK